MPKRVATQSSDIAAYKCIVADTCINKNQSHIYNMVIYNMVIITSDLKKKWVINLFDVPLTPTQEAVLAHGPNFAVTPQTICPFWNT